MDKAAILALFGDDLKAKQAAIRAYVKDKSNSREDRLEVWTGCPEHIAPQEPWMLHLRKFDKKYGKISWHDDFYVERYSVFDLRDVSEQDDDWSEEKMNDFIDECMDNGYFKFCCDW